MFICCFIASNFDNLVTVVVDKTPCLVLEGGGQTGTAKLYIVVVHCKFQFSGKLCLVITDFSLELQNTGMFFFFSCVLVLDFKISKMGIYHLGCCVHHDLLALVLGDNCLSVSMEPGDLWE